MEESARNLRALTILSTALTIPFRVPEPDSVGVLVVTKDIWSLRLGWSELLLSSDAIRARGALTEMNLLGLDKAVALRPAHRRGLRGGRGCRLRAVATIDKLAPEGVG